MLIFGKRNDEQEDDLEEDLEENEIRPKKIRDLKPENKNRRKEPIKPWGKKERLIILSVIIITIFVSAFLFLSSKSWQLPKIPNVKLPSFNLLKEDVVIFESGNANKEEQKKSEEAISNFENITQNLSGRYGFYVVDFKNQITYGVNHEEIFQAASLIKLPAMTALFKEAEDGNLDLDEKYVLKETDKIPGSGSLAGRKAGTVITFRELAKLMGNQSDNTAFGIVRKKLGDARINKEIKRIGMKDTSLEDNETSPEDIGLFFSKLWMGKVVSNKSRDEILGFLTDTIYEDWLVKGVPSDVRIAHKFGREVKVINDAGIVFAKEPFVLVVMTKDVVEAQADEAIPEISKVVYEIEGN